MNAEELRRVELTCQCRDTDIMPRVTNAGVVEPFRGRTVQLMHNGIRVLAGGYYGDWMVEIIRRLRGCHEPQEEVVFWELLKRLPEAPVMVELGAFWAYYSCWFLKDRPAGRVYCIEPDPNNLAVGRANMELNSSSATFIQAAVGGVASGPKLYVAESDGVLRTMPVVSVDSLVRDHGISYLDILLADIQGAETRMLEGCRGTIWDGKLRFLLVSTHHHSISGDPLTHQKCLSFIRDNGGRILAEHTVAESFSGDGLIAASFAPTDRDIPEIPLTRNRAATNMWRETEYDLAEALAAQESLRTALVHVLRAGRRAVARRLRKLSVYFRHLRSHG
jgi:FkbM family methyltransferase